MADKPRRFCLDATRHGSQARSEYRGQLWPGPVTEPGGGIVPGPVTLHVSEPGSLFVSGWASGGGSAVLFGLCAVVRFHQAVVRQRAGGRVAEETGDGHDLRAGVLQVQRRVQLSGRQDGVGCPVALWRRPPLIPGKLGML
jgi:hypothetical protein